MNEIVSVISGFVWGPFFLIPLLLGTGLYLTVKHGGIQVRAFWHSLQIVRGKYHNPDDPGEVSHFRALSAALSATIGTGNIVGVAAAITYGGPGAVFWMWVTAFLGMALKHTSCLLSVRYRSIDSEGEVHGGPMHYIFHGMGPSFKWLAVVFALFTALASFGIGNMFQVNNIVNAAHLLIPFESSLFFNGLIGLVFAIITALVIIGGIRRIAAFTSYLVPFMCAFYFIGGIIILIKNWNLIPQAFQTIFYHAFHAPESLKGGVLGSVIRHGVARGLFSNEAGLGSSPIAHGAAKTKEPVREGFVGMLEPFIDTLIICTLTALVIISTQAHKLGIPEGQLTAKAFHIGLPGTEWIVAVATILFAFSTILSWSYYGDRASDFLFGKGMVKPYRIAYVLFVVLGACLQLKIVINLCDILNGLMAIPNLIALIVLSPQAIAMTKEYMKRHE